MYIRAIYFTEQGKTKYEELSAHLADDVLEVITRDEIADTFAHHWPILFIGAAGIAVRFIAGYVKDKLADSPVLVMDEKGQFVIPVLAGHIGGANELAVRIAAAVSATPVLTTATDVQGVFAVDVFAKKNGLYICNRDGIKKISSRILSGETVNVYIDPEIIVENTKLPAQLRAVDCLSSAHLAIVSGGTEHCFCGAESVLLRLSVKPYTVGMGCRKGKDFDSLNRFFIRHLKEFSQREQLSFDALKNQIAAVASVDLKAREPGLNMLAQSYHLPFVTFTPEELSEVDGNFSESAFVRETTGIGNICERSALRHAEGGQLVLKKTAENGMTIAVAKGKGKIKTW